MKPLLTIFHRIPRILTIAALALGSGFAMSTSTPTATAGEVKPYNQIDFPELNELQLPEAERLELDNGLVVFLLPDRELPLVNFFALNHGGVVYDPEDKAGLAAMTAEVMRSGGSVERSGDEIDEYLESIAARIEFSASRTTASAEGSSLVEDFPDVLKLFAEILREPAFPEDKLALERVQQNSAISRRNDQPMEIAQREFRKLIYGADSSFTQYPEYETIANIGAEDLKEFHKTFYQPAGMVLCVWGDFEIDAMKTLVKDTFGDWKKTEERPELPSDIHAVDPGLYVVSREVLEMGPERSQSVIFLGHVGGKRDNPDFFPLQVMNRVLSEGFTSRLFVNVRSTKGLAYAVFGQYASFYEYPGIFYAGSLTQSQRAVEAVEAIKHEIRRLREDTVSEQELHVAKEGFLNSFVFNFDDKGQILQRLATYELHGYPLDFLQKTRNEVEKVTREDVLRVAKEYLRPEDLRVLVVGNLTPDSPLFEPLGEATEVDVTIPEPEAAVPAAETEE